MHYLENYIEKIKIWPLKGTLNQTKFLFRKVIGLYFVYIGELFLDKIVYTQKKKKRAHIMKKPIYFSFYSESKNTESQESVSRL